MICEIISEDFFFLLFSSPEKRESGERKGSLRVAEEGWTRFNRGKSRIMLEGTSDWVAIKVSAKDKVVLLACDVFASEPGLSPLFNDEKPNREVMGAPFPQAALISFDTV